MGAFSYKDCNSALNKVFFDGRFAGQPVYLTLDNEMRQEVAVQLCIDPEDVESAICKCVGQYLNRNGNPYESTLFALKSWRRMGMKAPPLFTGILFCLSHAASLMAAEGDFASSNYYMRLAQVTGLTRQNLSFHGNSTGEFWDSLRDWLLQNSYALGKPTATAKPPRVYVGKAISQAVVRAGDRGLFHGLFERYSFSGSENISPKEMEFYLSHWITGTGANDRLRKVWSRPELQERVAEIALAELSKWGGGRGDSRAGVRAASALRVSLLANFVQKFPRQILELNLGRLSNDEEFGPFRMGGSQQEFILSNDRFGSYATLAPSPVSTRMGQRCHLVSTRMGERDLDWSPRLVIPLAKSDHGNFWTEVSKVSFGVPHVVLVRDAHGLPGKVESYLATAALKMPEKATATELPGLPAGWVLYKDVQVRQPDKVPGDDLECLVPWSNDGVLSITEGMQLLPSFYHSSAPLTAEFVASSGPTRIEAWTQDAAPSLIASSDDEGATCRLHLDGGNLRFAMGLKLRAFQADRELASTELYFRNSNSPHPPSRDGKGRLVYRSLLSATAVGDGDVKPWVSGMETSGEVASLSVQEVQEADGLPDGAPEDDQLPVLSEALDRQASAETCIERGYHYWICETLQPGRPRNSPLEQNCSGCATRIIMLHRGTPQAGVLPPIPIPINKISPPAQSVAAVDPDRILDALCFLGQGNWGKFQALVASDGNLETHQVRQLAQDLFLLGFIDIGLHQGTNTIKNWSVPRASINFVDSKKAFLSGYRSPRLLKALRQVVEESGGRLVKEELDGRPRLIWMKGLDMVAARAAILGLKDSLERDIIVVEQPGNEIARAMPVLDGMQAALKPVSIGRPKGLQVFDVRNARWIEAAFVLHGEAYRWNEGFQNYAYVDINGSAWSGPHQVVKALAATSKGVSLWQYVPAQGVFRSTLGCEPPGLLGRALVACSGQLPVLGKGIVSYSNISPIVASSIMAALSMENFDEGDTRRSQSG